MFITQRMGMLYMFSLCRMNARFDASRPARLAGYAPTRRIVHQGLCFLAFLFIENLWCQAPAVNGESIYRQRCSGCHEQNDTRIPHRSVLQKMPAGAILRALDIGAMSQVAGRMDEREREAVAKYLGTPGGEAQIPASAFCSDRTVKIAAVGKGSWNGWSATQDNTRFQSGDAAGLTVDHISRLKLKWAFAFDGSINAYSALSIVNGTLFTGSAGGAVFALDARTGCIRWSYQAAGSVRSAVLVSESAVFFGDQAGNFYSLDAPTGRMRWKIRVDDHELARVTGSPVAHNGTIIVPITGGEEGRSFDLKYECCTMRGNVLALRARDGAVLWRTYTVDPPRQTGKNSEGTPTWGPSGAGVWSAPTLDVKRGLVYVTTGDNYSPPATEMSDAVIALELTTGRIAWSRQTTPGDVYNGPCASGKGQDCGPDFDFASSAMLVHQGGRDLLLIGQKSGMVYALDPDHKGEMVWQLRVGRGSTIGGVQWGMASDGRNAYAAVSDMVRTPREKKDAADLRSNDVDPQMGGGLTAIRVSDGSKLWYAPGRPCDRPQPGCSPAQSAAVTAIPGAVFSGSTDGHLRAFAAEDARVLWDFDTAKTFKTVNGIGGHGGSIDGPGAVVANGLVYVNSGYVRTGGMSGNVLLAFAPE
jgi:polyvinyl alcohol dehydrogenase (cytochrome)